MADMLYFVFRGGPGGNPPPVRDEERARQQAQAAADVDGEPAQVLGVPVHFLAVVEPRE